MVNKMNKPNFRLIGVISVILIALLIVWAYIPKAKLKITSNTPDISLELNSTSYTVQNNQTLTLRAGNYAYVATKDGYAPAKGFITVNNSSATTLSLDLRKQYVIEKEYPEYTQKYPNTTIVAEYTPQPDWLVVQLISQGTPTTKTLLVLNKVDGAWKVMIQGQDYVTPIQIAGFPTSLQNWLSDNNFVNSTNTDTNNESAEVD